MDLLIENLEQRSELLWELAKAVTPESFGPVISGLSGLILFELDHGDDHRIFRVDPSADSCPDMPTDGGLPSVWTKSMVLEFLKHVEALFERRIASLRIKITRLQSIHLEQGVPASEMPLAVLGQGSFSRDIW